MNLKFIDLSNMTENFNWLIQKEKLFTSKFFNISVNPY